MNWIRVEDRLPEKKQVVLAYGQVAEYFMDKKDMEELHETLSCGRLLYPFSIQSCVYDSKYETYFSPWFFDVHCCLRLSYNVKYWMPLPEFPKDGQ